MPSASRKKATSRPAKPSAAKPSASAKSGGKGAPKPTPKPAAKPAPKGGKPSKPAPKKAVTPPKPEVPLPPPPPIRLPGGRRHLLSLSFLRDGDEFMARMETDAGQITELKNRSLDQLLTLVASELEDLLE